MKVHVTLKRRIAFDPGARQAALARVLAAGRMSLGNLGRFERYGIITGEPKPERIDRIRALPEVEAVEVDEEESAGSTGRPTSGYATRGSIGPSNAHPSSGPGRRRTRRGPGERRVRSGSCIARVAVTGRRWTPSSHGFCRPCADGRTAVCSEGRATSRTRPISSSRLSLGPCATSATSSRGVATRFAPTYTRRSATVSRTSSDATRAAPCTFLWTAPTSRVARRHSRCC